MFAFVTTFTFLFNALLGKTTPFDTTRHIGHYETLSVYQVTHDTGQNDNNNNTPIQHRIRTVKFFAHGRSIVLKLRHNNDILADDFDSDARPFVKDALYSGYVEHHSNSDVLVAIDNDDGTITGTLFFDNLTMHIEPLRIHVKNAPKNKMLIYVQQQHKQVGNVFVENLFTERKISRNQVALLFQNTSQLGANKERPGYSSHKDDSTDRTRRSTRASCHVPSKNLCKMYLVADYRFYQEIGRGDEKNTIYHMLQAVRYVNKIFKETGWSHGQGCNIGLAVGGIHVLKTPGQFAFNPKSTGKQENYISRLEAFFEEKHLLPNWRSGGPFCLAHLFTYRDFNHDVVGYAYIGSKKSGICSERNVAFSNYYNSARDIRLFTLEANLVTTHEIAHNFGARHDEQFSKTACNPGRDKTDGSFLMYSLMVTGHKPNNIRLSPCSVESISEILAAKREMCFTPQNETLCTNGVIDEGEECDFGLFANECCDKNCRLKAGKQCSDFNHVCCTNCMFTLANNKTCQNSFDCNPEIKCNGMSAVCPNATLEMVTDNRLCDFGKGNCMRGGCIPVCKQLNQTNCDCQSIGVDSCFICCENAVTGRCQKVRANWDGIPCGIGDTIGTCKRGTCTKLKRRVDDEFKILLENFSLSNFGRFLKKNIVGTVLVFSILFWAPVACLVHYLDKKQDEEDMFTRHWSQRNNSELVLNMGARKRLGLLFRRQAASAKKVSGGRFHISS